VSTPLLRIAGLHAGYAGAEVLHGVDLEVARGEVVALLGPNGAGKSTLLLVVSGLVPVTAGVVEVLGVHHPVGGRPRPARVTALARKGLVHVPEDRGLFAELTVTEHLRLNRRRRRRQPTVGEGVTGVALSVDEVLAWFPALARVSGRRAGVLSGGEQQMLALARAVLDRPRLLLVDEMSLGLAPVVVEQLLPAVGQVAARTGAGVLLVEQHVPLALGAAQRAVVLAGGRVLVDGTAAEVAASGALVEAGYLGGTAG
jgi:branched-chain amino acid transport system ATP-binding protein